MGFSEHDLHECLKLTLETLIEVIRTEESNEKKVVAAVNLANIVFEINAMQTKEDAELLFPDEEDEEE